MNIKKIMQLAWQFIAKGMKIAAAIALAVFVTQSAHADTTIGVDPASTLTTALGTDFGLGATVGVGMLVVVWAVYVVRKGLKLRG